MGWHVEGGRGEVRLFSDEDTSEIRFHGLHDPYGDGYVQALTVDISMTGLHATQHVTLANAEGWREFVRGIRDGYAGWDGVKEWEGADRDLHLSARHDRRANVLLCIRVGPGWRGPKWAVEVPTEIEAGEEAVRLADAIESFLDG